MILLSLFNRWVFILWRWYYNKTQHTRIRISQKITHHAQTEHSTQSYTYNKEHITHDHYNTQKSKAIPVTGRGGLWGYQVLKISHCQDTRLKMAARLSDVHNDRALLTRNIIFMLLVLISVRG
jgi:hypothetical protein